MSSNQGVAVHWEAVKESRGPSESFTDIAGSARPSVARVGGSGDVVVPYKSLLDPNPNSEGVTLNQPRVKRRACTLVAQPWVPLRENTESPNGAALKKCDFRTHPVGV